MPVLYVDKLSAYNGSVDYHTDFELKFLRNFSNLNFLLQVIRFKKANQIKSRIKISVRNKLKLPLFYNASLILTSDNDVTKFESVYIFKAKVSILEFLEDAKINYLRKKKVKHLEFYKEKNVNNLRKNLLGMSEYSTREKKYSL